jgi:hypothetical protein
VKLWSTGEFTRNEIAEILRIPKESVDRIIRQNREKQTNNNNLKFDENERVN